MGFEGGPLLSLVIFLPLLGAVVVLFLPRGEGGLHKGTALVTSIVTFLFSIPLWLRFKPQVRGWQFEQKADWAPSLGFGYHIGLDGVALLLVMLTTLLGPIVVLSSWKYIQDRVKEYSIALLVLETAMIGTLAAPNYTLKTLSVEVAAGAKLKRAMELANKLGARYALILGDDEILAAQYTLKEMRSGEQHRLTREELFLKIGNHN